MVDGRPDTYVITGDIDAMWLRDSSAQVYPYLGLMKDDVPFSSLIATRHQPPDPLHPERSVRERVLQGRPQGRRMEERSDGHEARHSRAEVGNRFALYPIRLAHEYWKLSKDTAPFE